MSEHQPTDFKAGVTGFLLGAVVLAILVFTIVKLTNGKYDREQPAPAAASQP